MEIIVEALLPEIKALNTYLDEYVKFFQRISRRVFQDINSENFINKYKNYFEYTKFIKKQYNILTKTASSIVYLERNRHKTLIELRKEEKQVLGSKIIVLKEDINTVQDRVSELKELARNNIINPRELEELRNKKQNLYDWRCELDRMTSKHKKLSEQIKSGHVKMTFGGEKLFNAQHHLKESGFSSYNEWKEAYNFAINHDVFYISRLDEKLENQIVRLTPSEDGRFSMKLLIDLPFLEEKKKFIEVKGIQISSEDKFTRDFLLNTIRKIRKSLIIYHFYKMESGKWNLQIIFNTDDMDSFTNL